MGIIYQVFKVDFAKSYVWNVKSISYEKSIHFLTLVFAPLVPEIRIKELETAEKSQ